MPKLKAKTVQWCIPHNHSNSTTQNSSSSQSIGKRNQYPLLSAQATATSISQVIDHMDSTQSSKAASNHPTPSTNHHRACRSQPNDPPASRRVHSSQQMPQGRANELDATPHITISKHAGLENPTAGVFHHSTSRRDETIHGINLEHSNRQQQPLSWSASTQPHRHCLTPHDCMSRMDRTHPPHRSLSSQLYSTFPPHTYEAYSQIGSYVKSQKILLSFLSAWRTACFVPSRQCGFWHISSRPSNLWKPKVALQRGRVTESNELCGFNSFDFEKKELLFHFFTFLNSSSEKT